jgi:aspartate racemase
MKQQLRISIIGGMGPYAGLDILNKFYENTKAKQDNEHLDISLLSFGANIPDRTEFLMGNIHQNPAEVLADKLANYPADIIGVACNTFHAPEIFTVFTEKLHNYWKHDFKIIHLPEEVKKYVQNSFNSSTKIAIISTIGAYKFGIYQNIFQGERLLISPNEDDCIKIHEAIYNQEWGIKSVGNQLTNQSKKILQQQIDKLFAQNIEGIILGCTELSLVYKQLDFYKMSIIDPNLIFARALINEVATEKVIN